MTQRPFLLRTAPLWLRTKFYYRFFRAKKRRPEFFRDAPLEFAPGFRMDLHEGDEGHGQMAFTGFYELELSRRLFQLAEAGGLLVDVGANYGYFSLIWAARNPRNRVIAYEASPRNQPALVSNVSKTISRDPLPSNLWRRATGPASSASMSVPPSKPDGEGWHSRDHRKKWWKSMSSAWTRIWPGNNPSKF